VRDAVFEVSLAANSGSSVLRLYSVQPAPHNSCDVITVFCH